MSVATPGGIILAIDAQRLGQSELFWAGLELSRSRSNVRLHTVPFSSVQSSMAFPSPLNNTARTGPSLLALAACVHCCVSRWGVTQ